MPASNQSNDGKVRDLWGGGRIPLTETQEFEELVRAYSVDRELVVRLLGLVTERYYGSGEDDISLREAIEQELIRAQKRAGAGAGETP